MQNDKINISEIFYSIQGEGILAGRPSVFIRLAGCPLRCRFCDTKYAIDSKAGKLRTIEKIVKQVKKYKTDYIVITGGEPIICPHLPVLCNALKKYHITIETAGIKFVPGLECDLMSISPKLSNAYPKNANKKQYLKTDQLKKLMDNYACQFKFVIEKAGDVDEVEKTLRSIRIDRSDVMLMPQAKNLPEYLKRSFLIARLCKKHHFAFSQRLQIMLWQGEKGK
ncbi:MAG: 7-carboxy-7-deazaguanine synthase QueE [Phycisphaerae bacterium]|jgi:7-carboxy-7-deazaguanine synthase